MAVKIFGKKPIISKKMGYKIGNIADKIGVKALKAIDTVAPLAAAAAPEAAPAILGAAAAAHGIDRAIRSGVAVANPQRGQTRAGNVIQFANDVNSAKQQQDRLKKQTALLRQ